MSRLRIGLVCPYALDVPGGVQNHVVELAEALRLRGHLVSVLAPAADDLDLPVDVVGAGPGIPVRGNGSVARLSFGPRVPGRVRRWLGTHDFDLVHVHEPTVPSLSLLAAWYATAPVVATFHTAVDPSNRVLVAAGGVARPGLSLVAARLAARIAVSADAEQTMRRHVRGDAVVVPNGLWTQRFGPGDAPRAEAEVAFLGRTDEPRKGIGVLARALPPLLERCPDARVVVAGHGDVARARTRLGRRLPVAARDRVRVLGAVDDRQRADLLARSRVYVAPHTGGESFGIVLAEAMASGAAVVASDLPAFRHVLDDGRAGRLFPVGDAGALSRAVAALLADEEARRGLVDRATRQVARYDWQVVAGRVERVYAEVLAGGLDVTASSLA